MRYTLLIALAATVAAPAIAKPVDPALSGLESVNVPVVTRADYVFDAATPDGSLPSSEMARLDAWLAGLNLGYGDMLTVQGPYAEAARHDVARIAGRYGMLVSNGAPVTAGAVGPGQVRVVVSRTRAYVPNCPNWHEGDSSNFGNHTMSNYGCAVNSNIAAMVANPNDLVYGRSDLPGGDGYSASKAIDMYRAWNLTGSSAGYGEHPLTEVNTKKGK